MAPIPPFFWRMASVYLTPVLTQILTQRLSRSPAFLRTVDKMIHHIDHLPNRLEGKPVPPYMGPPPGSYAAGDPKERGLRGKWEDVVSPPEDHGEPHDWQSPFPSNTKGSEGRGEGQDAPAASDTSKQRGPQESSRSKTAASSSSSQSSQASSQASQSSSQHSKEAPETEESPQEKWRREMRELQDKLRGGGR